MRFAADCRNISSQFDIGEQFETRNAIPRLGLHAAYDMTPIPQTNAESYQNYENQWVTTNYTYLRELFAMQMDSGRHVSRARLESTLQLNGLTQQTQA